MSSFDTVPFEVVGDGGQFPTPETDEDGVLRYAATIRIGNASRRNSLAARVSIVTPKRVYGRVEAVLHVEGGQGVKTLVVPSAAGTLGTRSAILVGLTAIRADARGPRQAFTADAEWVIVS